MGKFTVIAAGLGAILAFAANAEKMRRYFFRQPKQWR